jgi:hypothetical protein
MARTNSRRFHFPMLLTILSLALVIALPAHSAKKDRLERATTTLERITSSVEYLASDDLEGRGVGTDGLNKAADYIAGYFADLGLETDIFGGTPFQKFTVVMSAEMGPSEQNRVTLKGPASDDKEPVVVKLELGRQFNPLSLGGTGKADAPIVFVAYGISAPKLKYDDYAEIDVKGKVVVIIRKEPQQENPHSAFDGKRSSRHAFFTTKVSNAYQHGAAAVLIVNDGPELARHLKSSRGRWQQSVDRLAAAHKTFNELEEPTEDQQRDYRQQVSVLAKQISDLHEQAEGDGDTVLAFNGAGQGSGDRQMPVFFCQRKTIDPIIKASLGLSLDELEAAIDEDLVPRSAVLEGWTADCEAVVIQRSTEVKNVFGVLPGKGSLADETIVVGAHYDHLGRGGQGSLAPWTNDIHNGADDNASGTSALLEIAYLLKHRKAKSRRRIVFIAFSAEERGLLGSAHYIREPRFPLDETVAMVNLDMVGRMNDNKLIITGTGTSPHWDPLLDRLNAEYDFAISRQAEGTGPSDHQSFYLKDIPVLHVFTGLHNNYHRPSDDVNLLNMKDMARITQMTAEIVADLDSLDARPEFTKADKQRNVAGSGGDRPYFGSIPDFADTVDGLPLTGVSGGGPAEKAGIKAGDVVIQLGDFKIGGIEDFDSALRKFKAGDKVKVTVMRGKEKKVLTVTLGEPR